MRNIENKNTSQRAMIAARLARKGAMPSSDAAQRFGVSRATVEAAKNVLDDAPDAIVRAVERGELSVHGVEAQLRRRPRMHSVPMCGPLHSRLRELRERTGVPIYELVARAVAKWLDEVDDAEAAAHAGVGHE